MLKMEEYHLLIVSKFLSCEDFIPLYILVQYADFISENKNEDGFLLHVDLLWYFQANPELHQELSGCFKPSAMLGV